MAHKVFLSVGSSFNDDQEKFIKAIENYLEANDLIPQTVGRTYYSSLQPLKAVEELMQQCHGTIILALERSYLVAGFDKRDSPKQTKLDGFKLTTPWNQIEATIAYTQNHPLLVVVESGVKIEGLLERGYDWFVLEVDGYTVPVNDRQFVGVIADWKKRVLQFAEQKAKEADTIKSATISTPAPAPAPVPNRPISLSELRRNMLKAFNDNELEDLCFEMDIKWESLRGETIDAKAREIIKLCERNGRINDLIEKCRAERPHLNW